MKTANLSDVKNELSRYVDLVRHGETVRILVRRVPVADLVPIVAHEAKGFSEQESAELERQGVIRRSRAAWTRELDRPGPRVHGNAAVDAVVRERREGR